MDEKKNKTRTKSPLETAQPEREKTPETAANQAPPVVFTVHESVNPEWNPVDHLRLTDGGNSGRIGYELASPRAFSCSWIQR